MIFVTNIQQLLREIQYYKRIFPASYRSYEQIRSGLEKEAEEHPNGNGVFGLSVADEWEDKCYAFEFDHSSKDRFYFQFLGIWKC